MLFIMITIQITDNFKIKKDSRLFIKSGFPSRKDLILALIKLISTNSFYRSIRYNRT